MKKFGDFAKETVLDGDKISIDSLLNEEILILGYAIKNSKYKEKEYLTLQVEKEGEKFVAFTGSVVLADQVKKYQSQIPFLATIRKINKYYSLT